MKEAAHSENNARCATQGQKKRAVKPKMDIHACKRDMTEAGLKEDNEKNRAEWRKKLQLYLRPQMNVQATDDEDEDYSPRKGKTERLGTPDWFIKSLPPKWIAQDDNSHAKSSDWCQGGTICIRVVDFFERLSTIFRLH